MKRIEIRGVIVPSAYDQSWLAEYIDKGLFTPESRVRAALASANDDVELYINSQGGSVFAGNEMINSLKQFAATGRALHITVGAMAASMAANIVVMSGATSVKAFRNSKFMFHGAYGLTEGGKGAHEDSAELLGSINADVIAKLLTLPGAKKNAVKGWFEEGRMGWLSAAQALEMGIVGELVDALDSPLAAMDAAAAAKLLETSGLDVAALDFSEPATDPLAALTAQHAALRQQLAESEKRFAGLQSAKDKELAQLRADLLTAAAAQKTDFESQLAALTSDLSAANAALSVATESKAKAETALAETREQLTAKQSALARLTGGTLNSVEAFASWGEAQAKLGYAPARRAYPELHAAFMQAHSRKG